MSDLGEMAFWQAVDDGKVGFASDGLDEWATASKANKRICVCGETHDTGFYYFACEVKAAHAAFPAEKVKS